MASVDPWAFQDAFSDNDPKHKVVAMEFFLSIPENIYYVACLYMLIHNTVHTYCFYNEKC